MTMNHVLLAYDGSPSAQHALAFVLDRPAAQRPARLHLLNVQETPVTDGEFITPESLERTRAARLRSGQESLAAPAHKALEAKVPCETHVLLGEPDEAIVAESERLGCDQIVMGTRGLGVLKGVILGSVATRVVHRSAVPVTLVK